MADIRGEYLTVRDIMRLEQISKARVHQLLEEYGVRPIRLPSLFLIPLEEYRKIPPREDRLQYMTSGGRCRVLTRANSRPPPRKTAAKPRKKAAKRPRGRPRKKASR